MSPLSQVSIPPRRAAAFFVAASLLCGAVHLACAPPFQVPDEAAHFFRAYHISEGWLDLLPAPGRATVEVPAGLLRAGGALYGAPPFRAQGAVTVSDVRQAARLPLGPTSERVRVFIPNTLQYTFVPYVPQALGIAVARACGASALGLLYAARAANLLLWSLAIGLAIARLPALRWLTAAIALAPMAVSLRASASADPAALGAACLLVAAVAALAWGEGAPRRRNVALLLAAVALLCTAKAAYLPLLSLALLIPRERWPVRRGWGLGACAAVTATFTAWALAAARSVTALRADVVVDPSGQVAQALRHPLAFATVVAGDYLVHAPRYAVQLVGKLGWLDVPLPLAFVAGTLLLWVVLPALDGAPALNVRGWQRGLVVVVVAACLLLVTASQYALWTPLGAPFVEGVQGRYFLPIAVAGIWALHRRRPAGSTGRLVAWAVGAWTSASLMVTAWVLVSFYFRR